MAQGWRSFKLAANFVTSHTLPVFGESASQTRFAPFGAALKCGRGLDDWEVLILAAHPDDETIGAASLIWRAERLTIAHVTDGSPPSLADARRAGCTSHTEYAELRQAELRNALAQAGKPNVRRARLGFTDQRCSFRMADLRDAIVHLLEECATQVLVTHAYEGGHPDHDATAFAARQAIKCLPTGRAPLMVEMASYHNGPQGIQCGEFLAGCDCEQVDLELDAGQRSLKQAMLNCFRSQTGTLQYFATTVERFRAAPEHDFGMPPHAGTLFYERFPWGIKGAEWRVLAQKAALTADKAALTEARQ